GANGGAGAAAGGLGAGSSDSTVGGPLVFNHAGIGGNGGDSDGGIAGAAGLGAVTLTLVDGTQPIPGNASSITGTFAATGGNGGSGIGGGSSGADGATGIGQVSLSGFNSV